MIRDVIFEGDSLEIIRAFPENARHRAGYEIHRVQMGAEPINWKPFTSVGTGVREIRVNVGRQYRVIYIAKFDDKVHVLHAFQKKSRKTKLSDIDLAKQRLQDVALRYK